MRQPPDHHLMEYGRSPRKTTHCRVRHQQRAVPTLVTSLLLQFGSCIRRHGADVMFFDKRSRKRLSEALGGKRNVGVLERWLATYAVVGDDGTVVTVGWRTERLRRR